jgi:shikimate dehydrogenase
MTGMLGHPVAENPIDLMFDAVYAHYGLPWQFWKNDIATEADLGLSPSEWWKFPGASARATPGLS